MGACGFRLTMCATVDDSSALGQLLPKGNSCGVLRSSICFLCVCVLASGFRTMGRSVLPTLKLPPQMADPRPYGCYAETGVMSSLGFMITAWFS